jgi:tetratricopeptide (TPR) repeat protein
MPAAAATRARPVTAPLPVRAVGALAALPDVAARAEAAALLTDAAAARARGDLDATLELLQAAVERAPVTETHAALGALFLELGAAGAADTHLRAAAEGDPRTADRWIALANALALKPDPLAAATALGRARAAEPGLRVTRDGRGWLTRETTAPAP